MPEHPRRRPPGDGPAVGEPGWVASVLDLCGVEGPDRRWCAVLLEQRQEDVEVVRTADRLRAAIGTFPAARPDWEVPEAVAVAALLRVAPETAAWQASRGVDVATTRATLADVGRHLALHRRRTGRPGMATWWWAALVVAGGLVQLGRLQHQLRRQPGAVPPAVLPAVPPAVPGAGGAVGAGEWAVDLHVPETGPLAPDAVDASLARVRPFVDAHFPGRSVRTATCSSWLLDPYLLEHLPPSSNIAVFARRFVLDGDPVDDAQGAPGFVFGAGLDDVDRLPRRTTLQRLVLDRVAAGGTWQSATGHLALP